MLVVDVLEGCVAGTQDGKGAGALPHVEVGEGGDHHLAVRTHHSCVDVGGLQQISSFSRHVIYV